jgi:hypothetical protein
MRITRSVVPVLLLIAAFGLPGVALLQASPNAHSRFLITAHHTKEECVKTLDEAKEVGATFLNQCDWGCVAGDHTAYVILEGKDEASVRKSLPKSWAGAKITPLNKFTTDQIAAFHQK